MSYSFDSRIRFSEIGEDRKLTLNGIINYFQDCSNFHSEEVGLGLGSLEQRNRAWMLLSWQICVNRRPAMGEQVTVSTWPYQFKGFYGSRNFQLKSKSGEMLAYANSLWVFLDAESGTPARIEPQDAEGYGIEERMDMDYAPRKIKLPADGEWMEPFQIRGSHLDLYHHVNNGQYIQLAKEYLPRDFEISQLRAEYKMQAVLNSVVVPMVHCQDGVYTVVLCNEEKQPYTTIEFK